MSHPLKKGADDAVLAEIGERTGAGETSKQIAEALQAKGLDISHKSVSRRRLELGLRKRAVMATKGTKRPNLAVPRPERRIDPAMRKPSRGRIKFRRKGVQFNQRNKGLITANAGQQLKSRNGPTKGCQHRKFWKSSQLLASK